MNREGAEQLLDEFHTPAHIRAHCLQVARVGELLAQKLMDAGVEVDPETVWIAGMIHDFVRTVDIQTLEDDLGTPEDHRVWADLHSAHKGMHHADAGAKILEGMGEAQLAELIRQHKYAAMLSNDAPSSWEAKLLYYADKRVAHDEIVSLKERLREGKSRHAPDMTLTDEEKKRHRAIESLESEIFEKIDLNPEDIASELGEA